MITIQERDEVLSVIKAYQLVNLISEERLIGLTELTMKSGLKKTTVFRLLETLKKIGLVDQDKLTQQYFLTMQVVILANRVLKSLDLRRISRTFIDRFVYNCGMSMQLSILRQNQIVTVDRIEGREPFRLTEPLGDLEPPHCTASGKSILAYLPPEKRRLVVGKEPFPALTSSTITDWPTLEQNLNIVRQNGFAVDHNERHEQIIAVGAPIFNHMGRVVGAISIPRIAANIDTAELSDLGNQLIKLSQEISTQLGWTGIISEDNEQ